MILVPPSPPAHHLKEGIEVMQPTHIFKLGKFLERGNFPLNFICHTFSDCRIIRMFQMQVRRASLLC